MFDTQKYIDTAFPTEQPTWYTDNSIVFTHKAFLLRKFDGGTGPVTLVVPPQASHSSHIADYDANQSMIATILKARKGVVYCIEWLSCTFDRRTETIDDLVDQVRAAHNYINAPVHMVGLCQGGWLSVIYTSLYIESVISFTPVAAPIDFHGEGGVIYDTVTRLGMMPYRSIVLMHGGIMPGYMMLLGWKLMHPTQSFFGDYIKIITKLIEGKDVEKIKRFRVWYEHTLDLAGDWYLQAVEELFLKNKLIKGELVIKGKRIDLSRIDCPVYLITGEMDEITLIDHLNNITKYISSKDVQAVTIPNCGHIGCFMGTKSQKYIRKSVLYLDKVDKSSGMKSEFGSLAS